MNSRVEIPGYCVSAYPSEEWALREGLFLIGAHTLHYSFKCFPIVVYLILKLASRVFDGFVLSCRHGVYE